MKINLISQFFLLGFFCLFDRPFAAAQAGCTDPLALNFDAAATENDGSCTYPATQYLPALIAELPSQITEASGAEFFNGQFWLHQDGGVAPTLHTLDTLTGGLLQTIPLPSLQNVDWEDLAEDAEYLYIGDFGNNGGDRTDLRIYKINKNDLLAGTATAETIDFQFSDQTDFSFHYHEHNFDCEALIAFGDSLHIFSKRWVDFKTYHYALTKTPGTHIAQLRDSLDTGFLTSAADVSKDGTVVLMGYDNTSLTSIWMLWDFPGTDFFKGNKRQIILGNALNMSQAEGIAFSTSTSGFICTEQLSPLPARMMQFDIGQWLEGTTLTIDEAETEGICIYPNPFSESVNLVLPEGLGNGAKLSIFSSLGKLVWTSTAEGGFHSIPSDSWSVGLYYFTVQQNEGTWHKEILKQ